jgi:hypothetical protein
VVRVPGYRSRGPGFDSRYYQFFWEVVGLERGPLSLVSTIEELLGRKSSSSGLAIREYGRGDWSVSITILNFGDHKSVILALNFLHVQFPSVQCSYPLLPKSKFKWRFTVNSLKCCVAPLLSNFSLHCYRCCCRNVRSWWAKWWLWRSYPPVNILWMVSQFWRNRHGYLLVLPLHPLRTRHRELGEPRSKLPLRIIVWFPTPSLCCCWLFSRD